MTYATRHVPEASYMADPYWSFRPQFAEALDARLHTMDYLDHLVMSGAAQGWYSDKAALVTEIRTYPTGAKAICVLVAAGDRGDIVGPLREMAETWAREAGCTLVIVESREGWKRALKPHGYDVWQVALVKEL